MAPLAQRIALAWRLDLHDVGAEFGEQLRAERPGDQCAELEYAQAGERPRWIHGVKASRGDAVTAIIKRRHARFVARRVRESTRLSCDARSVMIQTFDNMLLRANRWAVIII